MALPRCEHDSGYSYWGSCEAPARFRVERADADESYPPAEVCPAHVADMMAWMLDGDDVPLTVRVHFDEAPHPEASPEPVETSSRGRSEA